jgi:AraC-like DNA-binding protein
MSSLGMTSGQAATPETAATKSPLSRSDIPFPLQARKRLRLIEARRMMISEGAAISNAAYVVGYESIPRPTRESRRMLGSSPVMDVRECSGRLDVAV